MNKIAIEYLRDKFFGELVIPKDNEIIVNGEIMWDWIVINCLNVSYFSESKPMEGDELKALKETFKKQLSDTPTSLNDCIQKEEDIAIIEHKDGITMEHNITKAEALKHCIEHFGYDTAIASIEEYVEYKAKERSIRFLNWTEHSMWTKWENDKDGYHQMDLWYNTYSYGAMEDPLTSEQLFELFLKEDK